MVNIGNYAKRMYERFANTEQDIVLTIGVKFGDEHSNTDCITFADACIDNEKQIACGRCAVDKCVEQIFGSLETKVCASKIKEAAEKYGLAEKLEAIIREVMQNG